MFRFCGHKTRLPSANSVVLRTNDVMLRIKDVTPCGVNDKVKISRENSRLIWGSKSTESFFCKIFSKKSEKKLERLFFENLNDKIQLSNGR